jgi:hypothetical protein
MELHAPLFLNKTNLQTKLDISRVGLQLYYDDDTDKYWVLYNGAFARLSSTSVAYDWPADAPEWMTNPLAESAKPPIVKPQENIPVKPKITAQVSTPMGHVFEGQGHGKSR